jgi:hypothetical protein
VTAPARYGDYEFTQWYGRDDGREPNDRVLEVDMIEIGGLAGLRYRAEARYVYDGPVLSGDINADLNVDLRDFSILAAAWLTELGDPGWDDYCDISSPADYRIDLHDVKVLCDNWLEGTGP